MCQMQHLCVHAVPYLWSGDSASNPWAVSSDFISGLLPRRAPSSASQGIGHGAIMPTVEEIQKSFEHARQRPPQQVDSEFTHATMKALRSKMQAAVDDSPAREEFEHQDQQSWSPSDKHAVQVRDQSLLQQLREDSEPTYHQLCPTICTV